MVMYPIYYILVKERNFVDPDVNVQFLFGSEVVEYIEEVM